MVKKSNLNVYVNIAEPMIKYYDTHVTNDKKVVRALQRYKYDEYTDINQLLLGTPFIKFSLENILWSIQNTKNNESNIHLSIHNIQEHLIQIYKKKLVSLMDTIKIIDKLILNAPALTENVTVYRGIKNDVYDDFECKENMFYWTSPNYMSTSFSKDVSDMFKSRHGIMFIISLPPETRGIFLPWDIPFKGSIGNSLIDNEYELLLPHGCKFLVESIDYVKSSSYKVSSKYKNIPCEKKFPLYTKVYKMRLISQPSLVEFKRDYNRITKNVQVQLKPWDFEKIIINNMKMNKNEN